MKFTLNFHSVMNVI